MSARCHGVVIQRGGGHRCTRPARAVLVIRDGRLVGVCRQHRTMALRYGLSLEGHLFLECVHPAEIARVDEEAS